MGCNQSSTAGAGDGGSQRSRALDRLIMSDKAQHSQVHKLLLLGTGNSGKSTFFKQLTQIHGGGLEDDEYKLHSKTIQGTMMSQMEFLLKTLLDPATNQLPADFPAELEQPAQNVTNAVGKMPLDSVAEDIITLWEHPLVRGAYDNRSNLGIADSAAFFFDDIARIRDEAYKPTFEDILLARIPTSGMLEKQFVIKDSAFKIVDVGGQRSERSKWIHCFEVVHAILFVASLSCYDQFLYEDEDLNAMRESLQLFSIVAHSRYFRRTTMILFLNKSDLFREKIGVKPLTECFPEYKGEQEFTACSQYIGNQYKAEMGQGQKVIHIHVTCATDRNNVMKIFDDVQHLVVMKALNANGLL